MKMRSKWFHRVLVALPVTAILLTGGFYVYTLDYYHADTDVASAFSQIGVNVQTENT